MDRKKKKEKSWHPIAAFGVPGRATDTLAAEFAEALELNASPTTSPFINHTHLENPQTLLNSQLESQQADALPSGSFRSRVSTMPSPSRCACPPSLHADVAECRVRSYSVTAKGLRASSESSRSVRRHPSNASVSSWSSGYESRDRTSSRSSDASTLPSVHSGSFSSLVNTNYAVVMLGSQGVGKTSLVNQYTFTLEQATHEYDNVTDASVQDKKTVSITLDGETSDLTFHDQPAAQTPPELMIREKDADAYVVVYSVTDRVSFSRAKSVLAFLQKCDFITDKAVILVGNKTDLVRARVVQTEDGKSAAMSYDCKFIETSEWMSHNVDELLVGILSQIRLKLQYNERQERKKERAHRYKGSKTSLSRSRSIVRDFFRKINNSKSKSCDNLLVL